VGGVFYVGGLHAANHRFFCAFEPLNRTQRHSSGGGLQGLRLERRIRHMVTTKKGNER
jgi:hypothetical protein